MHHSFLEGSLIALIESYDAKTVGVWICNGWSCIKSNALRNKLNAYLCKLQNEGTQLTKNAAKQALA